MTLRIHNALAILKAWGPEPIGERKLTAMTEFLDMTHELNFVHEAMLDRGASLDEHVGIVWRTMWMLRSWHDFLPMVGFDQDLAEIEPQWEAMKLRLVAHYAKHGYRFEIVDGNVVLTPIKGAQT